MYFLRNSLAFDFPAGYKCWAKFKVLDSFKLAYFVRANSSNFWAFDFQRGRNSDALQMSLITREAATAAVVYERMLQWLYKYRLSQHWLKVIQILLQFTRAINWCISCSPLLIVCCKNKMDLAAFGGCHKKPDSTRTKIFRWHNICLDFGYFVWLQLKCFSVEPQFRSKSMISWSIFGHLFYFLTILGV